MFVKNTVNAAKRLVFILHLKVQAGLFLNVLKTPTSDVKYQYIH